MAVGLGQTATKVVDYAEKTTPEAFVDDVQAAAQKPETYEQIVSLAIPGAAAKLVKVAQGSKLAATVGRMGKAGKAAPQVKTAKPPCKNCGNLPKCFVAGTLILTENGLIPIEQIEEGDKVWAYSDSLHVKDTKAVLQTIIRNATQLTTLVVGKDTIRCTPEHPFYVSNTWIEAGDLEVGDSVFLFEGSHLAIESVWTRDTSCLVYNFEVDGFHTYFVGNGGFLVHNSEPCFGKRIAWKEGEQYITTTETTRIGSWMSPEEFDKMMDSGILQTRSGGATHVLLEGPESFAKQAPLGSYYVEFNIPEGTTIRRGSGKGWGIFHSTETGINKLLKERALDVTQPAVSEIRILEIKNRK